ncbi:hypothetical protein [Candidatus Stoquefichus sp. SB1]|uniref:hypothetical protein n=1 Tax=Candidatus Stoquefichus sp. SB1 TaxID=1658109 RepID=UPI00067EFBBD|nr:hypothetical protein [Candidatus Stoquefichus sp. SB1]
MKKKIGLGCLVVLILLGIALIYQESQRKDEDSLTANPQSIINGWNLQLPEKMEIEYQRQSPIVFASDGLEYFIAHFEDDEILDMMSFQKKQNNEIADKFQELWDCWIPDGTDVPMPPFVQDYYFIEIKKNDGFDTLYVVYFPMEHRLYVLENRV